MLLFEYAAYISCVKDLSVIWEFRGVVGKMIEDGFKENFVEYLYDDN